MRKCVMMILLLLLGLQTAAYADAAEKIPLDASVTTLQSGKTYTISNEEELYRFAEIVNNGSGQVGRGSTVELAADISVNPGTFTATGYNTQTMEPYVWYDEVLVQNADLQQWTPVGSASGTFRGTFNGNGYTVSGLYCTDSQYAGLFGRGVSYCVIKNVTITNSYFSGAYAGGICGWSSGLKVENCISSAVVYGEYMAGGVCGFFYPAKGYIKNCTNRGEVYGGSMAGASCGWNHTSRSEDCSNEGIAEGWYFSGCMDGNERIPEGYVLLNLKPVIKNQHYQVIEGGCQLILDLDGMKDSGIVYQYDSEREYICIPGDTAVCLEIDTDYGYEVLDVYGNDLWANPDGERYMITFPEDVQGVASFHINLEQKRIAYAVNITNETRGTVTETAYDRIQITPKEGSYIEKVLHNGVNIGAATTVQVDNMDIVEVYFAKIGETWRETVVNDKKGRPEEQVLTEEQKPKVIKGVQNTTIKAKTVKVSGSLIRVCWEKSPGYRVDYFQVFRSTKRNSGYGTKAFYTTKTGKATYYTNSKSLKKGTRYYYKVRGVRVIDGKKYYTKWSNKAYRTAGTW